jgi:acyl-CoA synthetase (AMP-forming)/AMP-acid ligase II
MAIRSGGAPLSIAGGVREFGRAMPHATAVVDGDRTLTYRGLDDRASRLGNAMLEAGVAPGDRVGVLLGNRLEYPEVAAGLAKAGMPMVPINPRLAASEVEYILGHSGARALILDGAYSETAASAVHSLGIEHLLAIQGSDLGPDYEAALEGSRSSDPAIDVDEGEPFCIAYTSGTTGNPKGVLISHRSRCLTFLATALEWGLGPGRRTVAVAPMYHGAGFAFAYAAVFTGGTVSMLRRWDPEGLLALIESGRAHSVFLVPTHAQMIRGLGEDAIRKFDLTSLEVLYFNAAAMPFPLKQWVIEAFPGVGVHEVYGSTEAGVVTCLRPPDQLSRPGSVGPPWFLTEIELLDDDRNEVTTTGVVGELYSRSPYLMNGYLDDAEATEACTTKNGFLSAGDLARRDEDGFVYIVDRKKEMIITGGVNVYPREVEDVLVRHPAVDQVAVIGTASEQWGEQVTAVVVAKQGRRVEPEELDALCRGSLAGFKVPRRYEFVEVLPTSAAGKILKRELRDQLSRTVKP